MKIILAICGLIGVYQGLLEIRKTTNGYIRGVLPSNSLLEFVFLNR
jgi:hypothetical protein